jgi:hypothetical protein
MRIIKEITERIKEEMEGVRDYIKFANHVKGNNENVFNTIMEIIPQEIKHIEMWHDAAVREINRTKEEMSKQGKEVSPIMLEMWQDEHEDYVEEMSKIRYKIDMLKH